MLPSKVGELFYNSVLNGKRKKSEAINMSHLKWLRNSHVHNFLAMKIDLKGILLEIAPKQHYLLLKVHSQKEIQFKFNCRSVLY